MNTWVKKAWQENRTFLIFIALMFVFRSAIADWNEVPTGSMKPTVIEGDRVLVNKMAYDLRVPFTHISLLKRGDPQRGDIITFDSKAPGKRMLKRTIGLPGDVVELRDNVLIINGERLNYVPHSSSLAAVDQLEDLFGVKHIVRLSRIKSDYSSFGPVEVPEGHYLTLGDNRDNSGDSRVFGFVPRKEIVGRTRSLVLSLDYDNYYIPRKGRFLQPL